jgi:hypothetical protein
MYELRTEINIAAKPEVVWQTLTDTDNLGSWNPFIQRLEGDLQEGNTLEVELVGPGKSPMTFRPRVLKAEPGKELRWLGKLIVRGVFDGEHIFELEPTPEGTRFVHREQFSGILVPLLRGMLERDTRPGFLAMNQALKARAEESSARLEKGE